MEATKHGCRWKMQRFCVPVDTQKNPKQTQHSRQHQMFRALHGTHFRTECCWEYTDLVKFWCLLQVLCTLVLP